MSNRDWLQHRKHWIFDLDGTLTHSAHDFDHMRRELGLAPETPILETLSAMPERQSAPLWRRLDQLEYHYAGQSTIMSGAMELLQTLHQGGRALAILTRNTMPVVEQTLKACGIDHFFHPDHILDRDACEPKPSPAGIRHLLELWQADAGDAVMVGDYLFDLEAGRNAGVATIHLDTGRGGDWSEITDLKVTRLDEITQLI